MKLQQQYRVDEDRSYHVHPPVPIRRIQSTNPHVESHAVFVDQIRTELKFKAGFRGVILKLKLRLLLHLPRHVALCYCVLWLTLILSHQIANVVVEKEVHAAYPIEKESVD